MARIRSPGYPNISLMDAIDLISKIFYKVRRNPLDREAAVREMGYSGLTGASAKALSNLSHYGLIDNTGKGMIRVSELAVSILHPKDDAEKRAALYKAAFTPELFFDIRLAYPDGYVSAQVLESFLRREGFAEIAIVPAVRSYMETYSYLQQNDATESHGVTSQAPINTEPDRDSSELKSMNPNPISQHLSTSHVLTPSKSQVSLNEPNLSIRGGETVYIEALLDLDGLNDLQAKIEALKSLLKPKPKTEPQSEL
jgi:hypothetical protein